MSRSPLTLFVAAILLTSSAARPAFAQTGAGTGALSGRILDDKTGAPLSDANVQVVGVPVVGTQLAVHSTIDGRYRISNIQPGTVTLYVRRLGYAAKTITGIYIDSGKTVEQDVTLAQGSTTLGAVVVAADRERGSVADALDEQRTSAGVVNSITREQMAKSPDGDAAQAARRVGGIAIEDGKHINARGLGGRYTTASLNGARIPSPEPEQKVVPLDLFPSALLDAITVSKTFTPDQPGDFSGAQVEIKTREFPADRQATYSLGSGMNAAARGQLLPTAPGVGGESFAFAGSRRGLPTVVRSAGDLTHSTTPERNAMINSFRDIWQAGYGGAEPNASMSMTVGGNDLISNHRFGYIASGTYTLSQEVHTGETRALARPNGTAGGVEEYNRFNGMTAGTSALWGGLLNLSTLVGAHTHLALNNTYNRTSDNDARVERGTYEDLSIPVSIQRLDYVQRNVWSSQFVGDRETDKNRLHYTVTASGVGREQPDRSELVRQIVAQPNGSEKLLWVNTLSDGAVRTFADLHEHAVESSVDFKHQFGDPADNRSIKFGTLGRFVTRDAETRAYSIYSFSMTDSVRALPPEVLFGGQFTTPDSSVMSLRSLAQGGSYTATDYTGAGFGMFDGSLSSRVRLTAGARYEFSRANVDATSTLNEHSVALRLFNDVLPSAAITLTPGANQNVRFSLTRTLARPEYRELAALRTRDVLGGVDVRGNPDLVRTRIDNADIRWEMYPNRGEVLSLGAFYKRFHDPIERVFLASNTNSLVTFLNAAGGEDYGVELEARRNLGSLAEVLFPLTVFTNATVMHSQIELGTTTTTATNPSRAMAGQAPYIFNAGLTYSTESGSTTATVLFNRIGERITSAGELPLPDVKETARSSMDFSLRFPVGRGIAGRVDLKNLLDDPIVERQGPVVRDQYRTGRILQAAFTWHQ